MEENYIYKLLEEFDNKIKYTCTRCNRDFILDKKYFNKDDDGGFSRPSGKNVKCKCGFTANKINAEIKKESKEEKDIETKASIIGETTSGDGKKDYFGMNFTPAGSTVVNPKTIEESKILITENKSENKKMSDGEMQDAVKKVFDKNANFTDGDTPEKAASKAFDKFKKSSKKTTGDRKVINAQNELDKNEVIIPTLTEDEFPAMKKITKEDVSLEKTMDEVEGINRKDKKIRDKDKHKEKTKDPLKNLIMILSLFVVMIILGTVWFSINSGSENIFDDSNDEDTTSEELIEEIEYSARFEDAEFTEYFSQVDNEIIAEIIKFYDLFDSLMNNSDGFLSSTLNKELIAELINQSAVVTALYEEFTQTYDSSSPKYQPTIMVFEPYTLTVALVKEMETSLTTIDGVSVNWFSASRSSITSAYSVYTTYSVN